ncbi:hypothetical protein ABPG72_002877 [Tetrahymena utriculariae]
MDNKQSILAPDNKENEIQEEADEEIKFLPPNNTVYINNLNERISIDDLKQELFKLFSEYGSILEIKAKKNIRMRGQAFVVFEQIVCAQKAIDALNRKNFYGKALHLNFAKTKSDAILKREGAYAPRQPKIFNAADFIEERQSNKKQKENLKNKESATAKLATQPQVQNTIIQPHHTLFLENLPINSNTEVIKAFFATFPGFKEVRLVPQKRVAFVEYEDEHKATAALASLQSFKIGDQTVTANYAKA